MARRLPAARSRLLIQSATVPLVQARAAGRPELRHHHLLAKTTTLRRTARLRRPPVQTLTAHRPPLRRVRVPARSRSRSPCQMLAPLRPLCPSSASRQSRFHFSSCPAPRREIAAAASKSVSSTGRLKKAVLWKNLQPLTKYTAYRRAQAAHIWKFFPWHQRISGRVGTCPCRSACLLGELLFVPFDPLAHRFQLGQLVLVERGVLVILLLLEESLFGSASVAAEGEGAAEPEAEQSSSSRLNPCASAGCPSISRPLQAHEYDSHG